MKIAFIKGKFLKNLKDFQHHFKMTFSEQFSKDLKNGSVNRKCNHFFVKIIKNED